MNRQIWTNQKRHLSMTNAEEQASALCALCSEVENTMHLLFECVRFSEPLWELVSEAITALTRPPCQNKHTRFMHIVQYITYMMVRSQHAGQVMAWFQEIKRDLIYRRFKRCMGRTIQPDWTRLLGHLINTLSCMVSFIIIRDEMKRDLKVAGTTWLNWYSKCNVHGCAPPMWWILGHFDTRTNTAATSTVWCDTKSQYDKCTHYKLYLYTKHTNLLTCTRQWQQKTIKIE